MPGLSLVEPDQPRTNAAEQLGGQNVGTKLATVRSPNP